MSTDSSASPHSRDSWSERWSHLLARAKASENTFMLVVAVIIGCLAGLGAVGFRMLIGELQQLAWGGHYSLDLVRSHAAWWIVLVPTVGGLLVGPLVYFLAREAKGHGVPEVMEAVALRSGVIRPRVVLVKSLASALSIASGGSVGREGPIVQIGSALGSTVGQWLRVSGIRLRTLVGCGAAAGIAATFNAPVAGALFAVEIILGDFAVTKFSPIVISSVMATVVSRAFLGALPAFEVPEYSLVSPVELVFYLVLGVLAALVARAFVLLLYGAEDLFESIPGPPWLLAPLGGAIVGGIGLWYPEVFGVGYEAIEEALRGGSPLGLLAVLLLVKVVATSVTIGSGGSGGIFAPSLFLGAMLGGLVGTVVHDLFPSVTATPGAYALVGMGAMVAGATHAPITAILIIFELTYDYELIVPLMGACIIATVVASRMSHENIYTKKLLRRGVDVSAGRELNLLRALRVRDVMSSDFVKVEPTDKLGRLVDVATQTPQAFLYVVDASGRLQGVIGYHELRETLLQAEVLRDIVVAADLSRQDVPLVTPEQNLDSVMRIFGGKNREEVPVVDTEGGRMLGTISRAHLLEAYDRELAKRDMVSTLLGGMASTPSDMIFLGEDHWMSEEPIPGRMTGRSLAELDLRKRYGVQAVLLRRPSGHGDREAEMVPGPSTTLEPEDRLVVVGRKTDIERFRGA